MKKSILLLMTCLVFCSCSNRENSKNEKIIDFSTFKVTKKIISHFSEIGKIVNAVKLETNNNSLIGTIYIAVFDENSGDFLVGDFGSSQKVFRFDKEGRFIRSYGEVGQGPGEHTRLINFTLCENGDIVLLTGQKLIKFSKAGDLLIEKRIKYMASDIVSINDLFYISVLITKSPSIKKSRILVLNTYFEIIDGFGTYDTRLEKYIFSTYKSLYNRDGMLYFLDYYDLSVNALDIEARQLYRLSIPNKNLNLNDVWNKRALNESDRVDIRKRIHRFSYIFGFNDNLFIHEVCKKKEILNLWLLNIEKKEIVVFPFFSMYRNAQIETQEKLFFDYIVGAYKNGIICVFDTVDDFDRFKEEYPILKSIQFETGDNPILVLFEIDRNIFHDDK